MSTEVAEREFASLAEVAAEIGVQAPGPRHVKRRWVSTVAGGHVSGLTWGAPPSGLVLLHEAGRSARQWDRLLLALDRPALAIDLPGHGRSDRRENGVYAPRRLAGPVAEAIRSFAPGRKVVAGAGLGALTAIALSIRHPELIERLVLVDTLPGTLGPFPAYQAHSSPEEVRAWLAEHRPGAADDARTELIQEADGRWAWRHQLPAAPVLDDETLWSPLTAVQAPVVLVRGPLIDAAAVEEFESRVPDAHVTTDLHTTLGGTP
ncbi:alpha/beta hydrolase [Acrocarpospora macrocephala]|uniref:Hydrolase n=1 Tax=Acrocarpospora macrocephala TaxID=150177 RepID=A0A5M3X2A8_9ACTN|nr:alpha/beta hydrolase [Acrocarpospora macrocephala]GES14732.1 hydrolase [Acrocarpospora macrocephala]